jgi:hypothetical protein
MHLVKVQELFIEPSIDESPNVVYLKGYISGVPRSIVIKAFTSVEKAGELLDQIYAAVLAGTKAFEIT